ncbi:MAG TPA: methyltransferase [Burkholderiaceae bacterium]|jgi:SAM-dependent methyltransferase
MPEFRHRDPAAPDFWNERFEQAFTPWDRAGVPMALRSFVAARAEPMSVLIPGCGVGYEVNFLADAGWDVTAIDFSPVAVATARAALGRWADRVVEGDFFAFNPLFKPQLIYERAFLCALPPAMGERIVERWAELLAPGGLLAGFFFIDESAKGPPFGITVERLKTLLEREFVCLEDAPVDDSIPVFAGRERWQVWRRKDSAALPI